MRPLRLGLLGRGIAHSLSPDLHHAALAAVGLTGSYRLIDCLDDDAAQSAFAALAAGGWDGLNVTTPFKGLAALACDQPGASFNTMWRDEGRLAGCSTDGVGLLAALASVGVHVRGRPVGLLGTGGAAVAVGEALVGQGATVDFISGRSVKAAQAVAERLGAVALTFGQVPQRDVELIIHCSRLGHGAAADASLDAADAATLAQIFGAQLRPGPLCVDIVYARRGETLFELGARRAGARLLPGVGLRMLIAQAAASFAHFTARDPPLESMALAVGVDWLAPTVSYQL